MARSVPAARYLTDEHIKSVNEPVYMVGISETLSIFLSSRFCFLWIEFEWSWESVDWSFR